MNELTDAQLAKQLRDFTRGAAISFIDIERILEAAERLEKRTALKEALKNLHTAADLLLAQLATLDKTFMPTKSAAWPAVEAAHAALVISETDAPPLIRERATIEYYILEDRKPVQVASLEEWSQRVDLFDRHVAIDSLDGGVTVSTVFLGVVNRPFPTMEAKPFETMINGGRHDGWQTKAATWEEAEQQHAVALALARASLN